MALFKSIAAIACAVFLQEPCNEKPKLEVEKSNFVIERTHSIVGAILPRSCEDEECWPETKYKRENGIVDYECGDFWNPKPCEDERAPFGITNPEYDNI